MFVPAIISLLVGTALGQRFKVLALAPVILLIMVLAAAAWMAGAGSVGAIGTTAIVAIAGVQLGYLLGLGIRHLALLGRANRLRSASLASSRPPRHAL